MMELNIRDLSIILSFSALVLVLSVIPAFPIIGFSGAITLGALSGTIIGLFLNPFHGLLVVIISLILTPLVNPSTVGLLGYFYFLPLILSWIVSLTFRKYSPLLSLAILYTGLLGFALAHIFFIDKYIEYLYYDGVVPIAYLVIYYLFKQKVPMLKELGAIIYGVLADHVGGSLGFSIMYLYIVKEIDNLFSDINIYNFWISIWKSVAYIYPVERTILILIGGIILLPVLKPWRKFYQS